MEVMAVSNHLRICLFYFQTRNRKKVLIHMNKSNATGCGTNMIKCFKPEMKK